MPKKITASGKKKLRIFFFSKTFRKKTFRKKVPEKLSGKNFPEKTIQKKLSGKNFPGKTFRFNFSTLFSRFFFKFSKKF